jgi:replicative DNA helicase
MSNAENINKILANITGINSRHFAYCIPTDEQINRIGDECRKLNIVDYNLYFDDRARIDINYITRTLERLKRKVGNIDMIVIDHLQITEDIKKNFSRIDKYGNITADLKVLAKENNCVVLCLSQLNRKSEEREENIPELSDLRESGDIEQNADKVIFIVRKAYYTERKLQALDDTSENYKKLSESLQKVKNIAQLYIKKNRNGRLGNIKLYFNAEISKFGDYAEY